MCICCFMTTLFVASVTVSLGVGQMDRCPSNLARNPYLKTLWERCYQFSYYKTNWYEAKKICSSKGGLLVKIEAPSVQQFLMDSLQSLEWERGKFWIGAHVTNNMPDNFFNRYNEDLTWEWIDGTPLSYSNWSRNETRCCEAFSLYPSGARVCGYLELPYRGHWASYSCSKGSFFFICEFEMFPESRNTNEQIDSGQKDTLLPTRIPTGQIESGKIDTLLPTRIPTEQTESGKTDTLFPTRNSTGQTESGKTDAKEQRLNAGMIAGIAGIAVGVLFLGLVGGFVVGYLVLKKRRNNHPGQDTTAVAVEQRVSAPPQTPNPAYVKAREGPIAEPLQDYEKLRTLERPQDISLDNYATPMQEDETYDIVI
uniref:Layilin-like isoform X1 n=1 Tax=Crassostrea virginica TaxID=6565 RepID=A0A8B8EF96_CRAVI|nr:layilin-like isoform X1 [Crassostrea virginica]